MRMKMGLCAATALVLLAGCQGGAPTNNASAANTAAPANSAAPIAPPANSAAPGNSAATGNSAASAALTREFLVGSWGIGGGCEVTIRFNADGTAGPPEGSRWVMEGNTVTVTQPGGQPTPAVVTVNGPDSFTATPPDAPARTFNRCPSE